MKILVTLQQRTAAGTGKKRKFAESCQRLGIMPEPLAAMTQARITQPQPEAVSASEAASDGTGSLPLALPVPA